MVFEPVWETPDTGRLDPQAKLILDLFAKRPAFDEPRDDRYIAVLRLGFPGIAKLAGPSELIDRVDNAQVNGPGGGIPVRIYRPRALATAPLLVWFHGGGFVVGDLDTFDAPLRALANRCACTVLSVEYRLAPEHPHPAALEDAYATLRWAASHAADLGVPSRRIVVGGDSAGGNIATVAAMLARDRGGPDVALQVLLYPDADARAGFNYASWREHDGRVLERASKDRQLAMVFPPPIDRSGPHVSPALAMPEDLRGLPPALIVTGEFDPQRDEGELYAERLREATVPVSLVRYPGMIHGFFQMAGQLDASRHVMARVALAIGAF
jgi:acetyl esterase